MEQSIKQLLDMIKADEITAGALADCMRSGTHLNVSGLCEQQKGYYASALAHGQARSPVIVVSDYARARMIARSIEPFVEGEVIIIKPGEMSLVSAIASSRAGDTERAGVIYRLLSGRFGAAIICSGALLNLMIPHKTFEARIIRLRLGQNVDITELTGSLATIGYERVSSVSAAGEFAARGDVVDVFPPDAQQPLRISFFDDEIDQLKVFDINTQRSVEALRKAEICPATEIIIDPNLRDSVARAMELSAADDINYMNSTSKRNIGELLHRTTESDAHAMRNGMRISGMARWLNIIIKQPESILDYIDRTRCRLFVDEFSECRNRIDGYLAEYTSRCTGAYETGNAPKCAFDSLWTIPDAMRKLDRYDSVIAISCLPSSGNGLPGGKTVSVSSFAGQTWRGRDRDLSRRIKEWRSEGYTVRFLLSGPQRTDAFISRMAEEDCIPEVIRVAFPEGFIYEDIKLVLIGEQDIFGSEKKIAPGRKHTNAGARITFFGDIEPGDYVVHDAHGIGRYEGIVTLKIGKSCQDYLKISYAKNATVQIPVDRIEKLSKYVGPAGRAPKLSSLDGGDWQRSVERARKSIKKLAYDLVRLYAARRAGKGFRCDPDDTWQKQFEENFPYVETQDQLDAIRDIKRDMQSEVPMDRLLCGDVGFGKTEVAFRAIFKCVSNGRQAFLLAPTTLLAQQHYDNFRERLASFPFKVVLMSRYVPAAVMKQNLKDIEAGRADVIIGTHRILSDDVKPARLGLLIIDEEQRFGVNHKEKIKVMKNSIDVLSLSATPIPRTLHMSMSGIRDISVLNEPPMNRRPVQTYVMEYNTEIIVQACLREIARGGQVFYLYNRTSDIDKKASELSELMPGVRIVYAHGKMSEHQMEKIVESFILGEADILVCTTIIESGVDMPNVNTMIVENADRFGLSQLYQIRGRVGRSDRQAYAYMTYAPDKDMNSDARKRLMAIREFTELGSGIKVAMRDLEVRGAGNLLGAEQHGQMDTIGYELYCRILDEEIRLIRMENEGAEEGVAAGTEGENKAKTNMADIVRPAVNIEIDFDSYIPGGYIGDEAERMAAYRRIANIRSKDDYEDFLDEVCDRYGEAPREVSTLAGVALIRTLAADAGFVRLCFREAGVMLYLPTDKKINFDMLGRAVGTVKYAGRLTFCAQGQPYLHYKPLTRYHDTTVSEIVEMLEIILGKGKA